MCLPLFALYYWFGSLESKPVYGGQYFTYDEIGNLTERCYEGSYNADSRIFFSYDQENNLIRISEEDAQGAKKTLVADTSLLNDSRLEEAHFTCDTVGSTIKISQTNDGWSSQLIFEEGSKILKMQEHFLKELRRERSFYRDESTGRVDRILSYTTYDQDANCREIAFSYDEQGNMTKIRTWNVQGLCDGERTDFSKPHTVEHFKYEYNKYGQLVWTDDYRFDAHWALLHFDEISNPIESQLARYRMIAGVWVRQADWWYLDE